MAKILLVDDEKSIQITLREFLEEDRHKVFVCPSFDDALKILKSTEIEIIISDIIMAGKSGLDLLEFVKDHYHNIQVIIITGEPNLNSAIRSIRSGAADYLAKPINIEELKESVRRVLKTHLLLKLKDKLDSENKQIRKKLEGLVKEKTRSLEDIEERYKSVAMSAPDAIVIMDDQLNIVETNKAAEVIFEYSTSEMIIKNLKDLLPSVSLGFIKKIVTDSNFINPTVEVNGQKKSGSKFPLELSISSWKSNSSTFFSALIHDISFRKSIEEHGRKLNRAVEQSANSIVITDINGNIEYVNPKFEEITGYSKEETKGKNPRILKTGFTSQEEYAELWSTILSGKEWRGEFYNKTKSGKKYWETASISPIKDSAGHITNFLAIKEDITEKKEAQRIQASLLKISNILQEEEDNYEHIMKKIYNELSSLLNAKNFFIALYKKETNELYFPYYKDENDNYKYLPAAGTLSYYTILQNSPQLITKDQYQELINSKKVLPVGTPAEIWAGVPIVIKDEPVGIVVAQDYDDVNSITEKQLELLKFVTNQISILTERVRTRNELAFEKEELSVTLGSLGEAVITTDLEGKITLVNNAVEKIFNVKQSMIQDSLIFKLFWNSTDNGLERIKQFYQRLRMGGKHYHDEPFTISFSQRKRKIINVTSSPLKISGSKIDGVVFVIRDITQQTEIENQLSLSQKMESIGQLAAGIAHEINTPMQYIGDNTTFLKDSFSEITSFIDKLKNLIQSDNTSNLKDSINDLIEELDLDFLQEEIPASIQQSQLGIDKVRKIVLAMKEFAHPGKKQKTLSDVNKGIEVTATISKNEWKYVCQLNLKLDKTIPLIPIILDEINQVILNMIVNAAHAIEARMKTDKTHKGEILISTKQSDKFVEIIIRDNGSGIPKDKISRIFDPFFTTKEVGRGTGQGLAIAHNIIVNKHHGKISVTSVEGQGTTFIIQLPIEKKD